MFFQSIDFGVFFVAFFFAFQLTSKRPELRKYVLLGSSYLFFGYWNWLFALLLILCSAFTLFNGSLIRSAESKETGTKILATGIVFNLLILLFYKYCLYIIENWVGTGNKGVVSHEFVEQYVVLPFGVLVFTLQAISYLFDTYRDKSSEKVSPLNVLLLLAYFPKLLAGPLVKPRHFFNQLAKMEGKEEINFAESASLILKGLFKKFVLANYIALQVVDPIFNNPAQYSSFDILMAIFAFALQLYWNLSAYSELAVGFSLLLGIPLPVNFKQPFSVHRLSEFWQRWFITFSTWLKDYVYLPVRSKFPERNAKILSILVVFFSGAIWYGTGLNTLFLGLIGAGGLLFEMWLTRSWQVNKDSYKLKTILVLSFVVNIALLSIFMRGDNLDASIKLLSALFRFTIGDSILTPLTMSIIIWGFAANFIPTEWGRTIRNYYTKLHPLTQAVIFGGVILLISTFGLPVEPTIKYFQF